MVYISQVWGTKYGYVRGGFPHRGLVPEFPEPGHSGIAVMSDDYRPLAFALAASSDRRSISAARPGMVI